MIGNGPVSERGNLHTAPEAATADGDTQAHLIINADDFGASRGINRGIVACHLNGIVTSTSLMVTGRALDDAVALARDLPDLAIGLHWDVVGESDECTFDLSDARAVRDEFARQLDAFVAATGQLPTHIDSHRHLHMDPVVLPLFRELVASLGLPLRGEPRVRFINDFYAQPEWGVTDLERISSAWLIELIQSAAAPGWTEIGCHPGYVDPEFESIYHAEREREIATLTDPRVAQAIQAAGIQLSNHRDLQRHLLAAPVEEA